MAAERGSPVKEQSGPCKQQTFPFCPSEPSSAAARETHPAIEASISGIYKRDPAVHKPQIGAYNPAMNLPNGMTFRNQPNVDHKESQ